MLVCVYSLIIDWCPGREKVSKEAEVEDEFSGLGRQIRKLSSRAALDFDTTTTMNNSRCKTETTKQVRNVF